MTDYTFKGVLTLNNSAPFFSSLFIINSLYIQIHGRKSRRLALVWMNT